MIAQIILLLVFSLLIATSAIALECYSNNQSFWKNDQRKQTSRSFLIFMIVLASLGIIGTIVSFFIGRSQ